MGQRDLDRAVGNLSRGVVGTKSGIEIKDNFYQLSVLLAAATRNLNGDIDQGIRRAKGEVVGRARSHFTADTKRPAEKGQGAGGRRMTGRFTFGDGQTFETRSIKISEEERGFGFPQVAKADTRTEGVWRALEWGLPGTEHRTSSPHFSDLGRFHIKSAHRLPRRFQFTSRSPSSAILKLNVGPERTKPGAGFEGKHFIEQAWVETLLVLSRGYERIGREAFKAWK